VVSTLTVSGLNFRSFYFPFAFLSAAQRLRVASPILFLAAALIFRRLRAGLRACCAAAFFGGRQGIGRFMLESLILTLLQDPQVEVSS
jgi:hypothetical protein